MTVRAAGFEQILARENAEHAPGFRLDDRNAADPGFDDEIGDYPGRRVGIATGCAASEIASTSGV